MTPRHDADEDEAAPARDESSHTKWVIGVVSTFIVALLLFFTSESYRAAQQQLLDHQSRISALEVREAAKTESARRVEEKVDRLERKVDELLARTAARR